MEIMKESSADNETTPEHRHDGHYYLGLHSGTSLYPKRLPDVMVNVQCAKPWLLWLLQWLFNAYIDM